MNQTQFIGTPPDINRHHDKLQDDQISSIDGRLTKSLESKLSNPAVSPDFDLHAETNAVLKDINLATEDAGGKLTG